jgi:hypothetical protein
LCETSNSNGDPTEVGGAMNRLASVGNAQMKDQTNAHE